MDNFNWLVMEVLTQQRMRERLNPTPAQPIHQITPTSPVRRTLASSLVRLGLRLDPAAGEGLGGLPMSLAGTEARR